MANEKLNGGYSIMAGFSSLLIVLQVCLGLFSCDHRNNTIQPDLIKKEAMSPFYFTSSIEDKPTLVLLHGLGSNAKAWNKLVPLLKDKYKIIAIDLPKFLDTDDKSKVGISQYAEYVYNSLKKLGVEKAHIVGHSMGGQIAIKMAVKYPDAVESLILLAPAGFEQFSEKDRQWFKTWVTKEYYLSLSDEAISKSFDINFHGSKLPDDARFMLEDRLALKADSVRYGRYLDYVVRSVDGMLTDTVFEDFSELKVPALVMFGSDDQLIPNKVLHPEETVEKILNISDKIPDAEKHLIGEAGHFLQWDKPHEIASIISNFLNNKFTNE